MHNWCVSGIYCQFYQAHLLGSNLKNPLTSKKKAVFLTFWPRWSCGKVEIQQTASSHLNPFNPRKVRWGDHWIPWCWFKKTSKAYENRGFDEGSWPYWQPNEGQSSLVVCHGFLLSQNRPPGTSCHLQNKVQHKQLVSDLFKRHLSNVQNPLWHLIIVIASWKGSNLMAHYNPFPGRYNPLYIEQVARVKWSLFTWCWFSDQNSQVPSLLFFSFFWGGSPW